MNNKLINVMHIEVQHAIAREWWIYILQLCSIKFFPREFFNTHTAEVIYAILVKYK